MHEASGLSEGASVKGGVGDSPAAPEAAAVSPRPAEEQEVAFPEFRHSVGPEEGSQTLPRRAPFPLGRFPGDPARVRRGSHEQWSRAAQSLTTSCAPAGTPVGPLWRSQNQTAKTFFSVFLSLRECGWQFLWSLNLGFQGCSACAASLRPGTTEP